MDHFGLSPNAILFYEALNLKLTIYSVPDYFIALGLDTIPSLYEISHISVKSRAAESAASASSNHELPLTAHNLKVSLIIVQPCHLSSSS